MKTCSNEILSGHIDLAHYGEKTVLEYNMPFIKTPDRKPLTDKSHYSVGILCLHGAADSPYTYHDNAANRLT